MTFDGAEGVAVVCDFFPFSFGLLDVKLKSTYSVSLSEL